MSNLQDVVRPLVDENQPFDIVATVWTRKPFARSGTQNFEDVLFSDVIFRGLTLKSRDVHAQVNLSIPLRVLSVFRCFTLMLLKPDDADVPTLLSSEISSVLENYDLRASFTLVPQSPSLLDGFVEHKSWLPTYWMTTVEMSPPGKSPKRYACLLLCLQRSDRGGIVMKVSEYKKRSSHTA